MNLRQKPTILHETDKFQIKKTVDMWVEVSSSSALDQDQHCHILIELNSYSMIDLVSISFVEALDLSLCTRKKHQHIVSNLERVSEISSVIYRIYHLQLHIVDR